MADALPFPKWPTFRKRGEACAWVLRMFPDSPPWLALEVAGDPVIWQREAERVNRG